MDPEKQKRTRHRAHTSLRDRAPLLVVGGVPPPERLSGAGPLRGGALEGGRELVARERRVPRGGRVREALLGLVEERGPASRRDGGRDGDARPVFSQPHERRERAERPAACGRGKKTVSSRRALFLAGPDRAFERRPE